MNAPTSILHTENRINNRKTPIKNEINKTPIKNAITIQRMCTCSDVAEGLSSAGTSSENASTKGTRSDNVAQYSKNDFVYALGQLRPFFSTLDLQREFEAAAESLGLKSDDYYGVFTYTDTPNNNSDLTFRPFLYIAEKACWVFSINNIDTYLVTPHYENELNEMINALQPERKQQTVALIGWLESTASENRCGGLQLPIVVCNQLLFEPTEALADIPLKLNDGKTREQRAVNFLAFNYSSIVPDNLTLPKPLRAMNYQFYDHDSGRARVEVILTYFNQGIEIFYSCGIDVTDQYPFVDFTLRNYLPNNT